MKAYDGVFIMNYILSNLTPSDRQPIVINNGSKILSINFNYVKIIDSFSFIPIALAEFTKAFGITEHKKGFFPHFFNTEENQNYYGPYPDKEFYGYKFFSTKKYNEFEIWYREASKYPFDFQKEFLEYCWSDVILLSQGCLAFRTIIQNMTKIDGFGIDPFRSAITIASLCHVIYRSFILKSKTLGYIPESIKEKNSSYKANIWLNSFKKNLLKEYKFGPYFVDGYDLKNKTVYEFHGCYFHGCPKCFKPETFNKVMQLTMSTVYKCHNNRIEYIKNFCNKLIEIWECDFDILEIKPDQLEFASPINPRDSLFGGRTNALKLYHKCKPGQKIFYNDFTSLYPYVQKTCKYPVGHPVKIFENFEDLSSYFGIIKCKVLPPRKLYIPVLPVKTDKLVFSLCNKCPLEKTEICQHTDKERSIIGTWCTPEINRAINEGYKILKIYEVWHFPNYSQYDILTKTGGIFTEYINLFLKGKQESSGFPSNVVTLEDKLKYQQEYYNKEGVFLDIDKIEKKSR